MYYMWPIQDRRWRQRGNSFGSCLLATVLFFGGIGFYYFNYFKWRHLEAPTEGLTVVKTTDGAPLTDFRRKTVRSVTDPLTMEINRIKEMRKKLKSKNGLVAYSELEQETTEIQNRLLAIMNEARLRRIPGQYEKKYKLGLEAISLTYKSLNELNDAVVAETKGTQDSIFGRSIKSWKKAKKKNKLCRQYFHSKDSF